MISELCEFGGYSLLGLAEAAETNPASLSRVKSGKGEDLYFSTGKRIERLYILNRRKIKARKLELVQRLTRDLQGTDVGATGT